MAGERSEQVEVGDGSFGAFLALPEGGAGPGTFHPMFRNPDATAGSWRHTLELLARSLEH